MNAINRGGSLTLLGVSALTIMVGCVIVPGLPAIAGALGVADHASWLVTLPSLGVVLFGPLAGRTIASLGTRNALCVGLALYGLLGVVGAFLTGPALVFGDRILLGGATALVMASGTGLISQFYEGRARLDMIARQGMAIELGGVVFLAIGGLLATLGWRWPFALYLFAWAMLAMVWALVPKPSRRRTEAAADADGASAGLVEVYVAAAASMALFFTAVIMLPVKLHAQGLGEAETGYFLAYVSLVAVGAAFIMPGVVGLIGERRTLIAGFAAYAAAHAVFAAAAGALLGIGFGWTIPLVNHMTIERSSPASRGRSLARLAMAIFFGQFLSSIMEFAPHANGPGPAFALASAASVFAILCLGGAALRRFIT